MELQPDLVKTTVSAYLEGSFPMAENGRLGFYFCEPRSVFMFESFHVSQRLRRICRGRPFELRIDTAFELVVQNCRLGRKEWISDELVEVYLELFKRGHAHSVEAWSEGKLAGGVYGTQFGAAFFAESMFHTLPHASNVCLVYLMERLKEGGFHFCDIQYANEHTQLFHPEQLSHERFMKLLKNALRSQALLTA